MIPFAEMDTTDVSVVDHATLSTTMFFPAASLAMTVARAVCGTVSDTESIVTATLAGRLGG
jgi:hypothetical protein